MMRAREGSTRSPVRILIPLILAVALVSRVAIVVAGGQFYWPDEDRYRQSRALVGVLEHGEAKPVASLDHFLFKSIGRVPAAVESAYLEDARIPAAFFALFSVVNIFLLAGIARRLGGDAVESGLVALLFAASTSFLYFTRHLLPYDVAMTFGLLAVRAAVMPDTSWRVSLVCGAWASLCFLTYFGYWTFGGAACVIHVLQKADWRSVIRRSAATAVGLATPVVLFVGASDSGRMVVADSMSFMADVDQGAFAEGWRVPFEYLWHAEHGLLLLWIASVIVCLVSWRRSFDLPVVRVGLLGVLFVYGTLAVFSTGFEAFVVYGRLARQLVPFFCLVTAAVLARLAPRTQMRQAFLWIVGVAIVIQAGFNARPIFAQQFPSEFISRGEQVARMHGASRTVLLYTEHLYPPRSLEVPAGMVEIFAAPHPLQFLPYQYEGYTPQERQFLRSTDIRMRVLIPVLP